MYFCFLPEIAINLSGKQTFLVDFNKTKMLLLLWSFRAFPQPHACALCLDQYFSKLF